LSDAKKFVSVFKDHIIKANLNWSRTWGKICQLIANLFVILPNWQNSNLKYVSLAFSSKKERFNADKLAIYWQNFARVW